MAGELVGALGGAGMGAQIGTMLLPGVGTAIGTFLGAGLGAIGAGKKNKNLQNALLAIEAIPKVDPNMSEFKDQLVAEKNAVASGFSTDFQVARDIIAQSEAGGMSVASELAQTNPALALIMMNQVSTQADASLNKVMGTLSTQKMGYTEMIGNYVDKIAQRKLDLEMLQTTQKIAIATAEKKDFNANMMAGATQLLKPGTFSNLSSLFNKGGTVPSEMFSGSDPVKYH